jgi:hypothetical protein
MLWQLLLPIKLSIAQRLAVKKKKKKLVVCLLFVDNCVVDTSTIDYNTIQIVCIARFV